jgi:anti-sigma factor RsiW
MPDRDPHVGEDAELYALGQLDEAELERFEAHVAACDECARRTGEAEATILQLAQAGESGDESPVDDDLGLPARVRPRRFPAGWIAAVAAAFIVGLLPWTLGLGIGGGGGPTAQQRASDAMLAGHFLHVELTPLASGAPAAKAIYARNGSWLYVLVGPAQRTLGIVLVAGSKRWAIAAVPPSMQTRSVFMDLPRRFDAVELDDGRTPVARAAFAYSRTGPAH